MEKQKIQILVDNTNSWMWDHVQKLKKGIVNLNFDCKIINKHNDVEKGHILILLSCNRIFKKLNLNKYNLVVHESDLPKGRGWSPLTWQILEEKNEIPITLFEANTRIDAGKYYFKDKINLSGNELIDEIRLKQANATFKLIYKFLKSNPYPEGILQNGESTYYKKRNPSDSQLDLNKSLIENFNILRVSDNDRYPAFFIKDSNKYILKIIRV